MKTLILGSCRVKRFRSHISDECLKKSFSICQHHLHNPYEIAQLLNWININDIENTQIHDKLHNEIKTRTFTTPENYYSTLFSRFHNAERIIIEISSIKRLIYTLSSKSIDCNLTSFAHFKKHEPELADKIIESIPKYDDFRDSIERIKNITSGKSLIIIPHYSWYENEKPLKSRETLRKYVFDSCQALNIKTLDPDTYIQKFKERKKICIDSSHYTEEFERLIARFVSKNF